MSSQKRKLINKKAKIEIDRYPLVEVEWINETLLERRLKLYRPLSAITDPRSLVPDFSFSFPVHWQAFRKACWDLLHRAQASEDRSRFETEAWAQDNGKKNSLDELELSRS
jgi:hypothetical protein